MKILLAPSETKVSGGDENFNINSLLFNELYSPRLKLLHDYTNIIQKNNHDELSKMFGLKKQSDIIKHTKDIVHELTMKAINRYSGVAFDYLDYNSLNSIEKTYIDTNVVIFSNLFGPILASDKIPEYRLKQGSMVGDTKVEKFYKENSKKVLDDYLQYEDILDLRAGFYDKFYKPSKKYTTLKFLKGGKVVSHWAKAYRGKVLREISQANISSIDEFMQLNIDGLSLIEIKKVKNKQELVFACS